MTSLAIEGIAEGLCGRPVSSVCRMCGGGNNRLYRVETDEGSFALKSYPPLGEGAHDRLRAEFDGLAFLRDAKISRVPAAIAYDARQRHALYQWIDGEAIRQPEEKDFAAAASFAAKLYELATEPVEGIIGQAAEACLSGGELTRQIRRRYLRLVEVAASDPELDKFLERKFRPFCADAIERAKGGYAKAGWNFKADIPLSCRTLSPSDFGFHNALRGPDGEAVFLDFEYFGWDDPVRLVADFVLHPGMALDKASCVTFANKILPVFSSDDGFRKRLDFLYPLVGLRWCMILLNEFLPERWAGRAFAGATDREAAKQRQLGKASRLLARLRDEFEPNKGFPFAA